jgi:hypothetical protein
MVLFVGPFSFLENSPRSNAINTSKVYMAFYNYPKGNQMDKDEIKALLKDVISNFIKDEPDAAKENFHDVLSAKMRDRVNPPHVETEEEIAARAEAEAAEAEAAAETAASAT